jgi:hypothetical protein
MKKTIISITILLNLIFLTGCDEQLPDGPTSDTVGNDFDNAIVVTAYNEFDGVEWEYNWLAENACQNNGGFKGPAGQSLSSNNGHNYDIMTAACTDGNKIDYYFMIDNYFGKL